MKGVRKREKTTMIRAMNTMIGGKVKKRRLKQRDLNCFFLLCASDVLQFCLGTRNTPDPSDSTPFTSATKSLCLAHGAHTQVHTHTHT